MTEPAGPVSFSLLALAVAWLGPTAGPYALIVFSAGVGALLALSARPSGTRWDGARYLVVSTLVALVISGPIVWAVETYLMVPARIALAPVAFVLGLKRDLLVLLITKALERKAAAAGGVTVEPTAADRGTGQ